MKQIVGAVVVAASLAFVLNAHAQNGPSAGVWSTGVLTYDGSGNIVRAGADQYIYDTAGRLVSGTADQQQRGGTNRQDYTYDSFGNRLTSATTTARPCANGAPCELAVAINSAINRMTAGSAAFDDAGSLKSWNEPHGGTNVHHDYAYDPTGMIFQETDGANVTEFVYTSDDQRIAVYTGQEWKWSVRDAGQRVARDFTSRDAQWSMVEDHIFTGRGPLASLSGAGARHFHLDHSGTTRLITDGSNRRVGEHAYYPFGAEIVIGAESPEERLKFTGHERDAALAGTQQLDYMHARFFGAGWGRFLSVDPKSTDRFSLPQSWNQYAYALNDPLKYVDRDGRDAEIVAKSDVGAVKDYLVHLVMTPTGRADLMRIINDHNFRLRYTTAVLTAPAQVAMDMKMKGKSDIKFGSTVPDGTFQVSSQTGKGSLVVTGATTTLDTAMIQTRHADSSGVTTAAHERSHALEVQAGKTGAALEQGDKPTNATGPAEKYGQQVAAEKPDISELMARRLIDQLVPVKP